MLTIAGLSAVLVPFTQPLAQPIRQPNPSATPTSLKRLSLEQLTSIEVTSVSRSRQSLGESAAAISIVTGEDIRRSGALTVPEALRLIPGIHAAQRNANSWAIASRGFSSVTSEKLLVLSDMRSIYTPLFSGVFWDAQDYVMEDIDRIEVIRGPGAALWGSNAVNGVINITTKSAQYTHGLHLGTGVGTEELARAAIRYGDAIAGQDLHYRVFAQYTEHDASSESFPDLSDDWRLGHVGVRADWLATDRDTVTMHAKAYRGNIGQLQPAANIIGRPGPQGNLEAIISGQYLQGRWLRTLGEGSELDFRAYYDHTRRNDPTFEDDLHTLDLDLQHSFQPTAAQHVTWGVNYRFTANRNEGKGVFNLAPPSSDDSLFSAFVQDQFSFADVVHLTLGTKLEHNDFSGFEWQPSVRAGWDVAPGQTLWAAVSRAVRVPTRLERDVAIDVTDPAGDPVARLLGSRDFESEELTAYEIGFRWQATDTLFLEFAAYHNEYDKLVSLEFGEPFLEDGRTIVPVLNRNLTEGHARGAEALVSYAPLTNWKVTASYAYIDMQLEPHGEDLNRGDFVEDSTPRHQFGLRSFLDLPGRWQLDTQFRTLSAVRRLPDTVSGEGVPGYSELDVRVAWEATEDVELSILGKNLLHEEHPEFGSPGARGEIQRSVYARIDARF